MLGRTEVFNIGPERKPHSRGMSGDELSSETERPLLAVDWICTSWTIKTRHFVSTMTPAFLAFDETGCWQLSQKVVQCSSLPVLTENFLSVFWQKKSFPSQQVSDQKFYLQEAALLISEK